jgi:hypothetical protein
MRRTRSEKIMGFDRDDEGELVALDPMEAGTPSTAVSRAKSLAASKAGAIARKSTPYLANGCPKTCAGCGHSFVIRNGSAEAIVGPDDQLYCYGTACDLAAFAAPASALKRAS